MGGAVAAAMARARRRVVSHFMSRNAVSPEKAVSFSPERRMEKRFFDRLCDQGVIVPAASGDWYLDVPKTRLERWWFDRFSRRGSMREVGRGNFYFDLIAYHRDAEAIRRRAVAISLPLSLAIAGIAMLFYRL